MFKIFWHKTIRFLEMVFLISGAVFYLAVSVALIWIGIWFLTQLATLKGTSEYIWSFFPAIVVSVFFGAMAVITFLNAKRCVKDFLSVKNERLDFEV